MKPDATPTRPGNSRCAMTSVIDSPMSDQNPNSGPKSNDWLPGNAAKSSRLGIAAASETPSTTRCPMRSASSPPTSSQRPRRQHQRRQDAIEGRRVALVLEPDRDERERPRARPTSAASPPPSPAPADFPGDGALLGPRAGMWCARPRPSRRNLPQHVDGHDEPERRDRQRAIAAEQPEQHSPDRGPSA